MERKRGAWKETKGYGKREIKKRGTGKRRGDSKRQGDIERREGVLEEKEMEHLEKEEGHV